MAWAVSTSVRGSASHVKALLKNVTDDAADTEVALGPAKTNQPTNNSRDLNEDNFYLNNNIFMFVRLIM